MGEVWFTADQHFGHARIIELCQRPFAGVHEMNEALIERWNGLVRPGDHVWMLGDVALGSFAESLPLVSRLHGELHLIAGNHDRCWSGLRDGWKWLPRYLDAGFSTVQSFARTRIAGQSVLLSHFPYAGDHTEEDRFAEFRLPDKGKWLIHGHVHTQWAVRGRQINVGVDVRDFLPVPAGTVAQLITDAGVDRQRD